jgi:hypothetical protein
MPGPRVTLTLAAVALLAAALAHAAGPTAAQPASGNYVAVATWQETASSLPGGVWNRPSGIDVTSSGRHRQPERAADRRQ